MNSADTSFFITCIFIVLSAPRLLRWLAIVQQKEYRLDRVLTFLKTTEGKQELLKIIPSLTELTRSGPKRPVRTARLYLVSVIIFFLIYLLVVTLTTTTIGTMGFVIGLTSLYLLWPLVVLLAAAPTALISNLVTLAVLLLAAQKIARHKPIIIGITGSYGKSTTKDLIKEILSQQQPIFATPLSYNTRFSIARSILKNYHGEKIAILEFGAYKIGEIKTLCRYFPPDVAVITGFSPQHLGLFGSEGNIIKAKSELVLALPTGAPVFCNDSDAGALAIAKSRPDTKLVEVTTNVIFSDVNLNDRGQLSFAWNDNNIQTKLVGRHYATNLKLAIALGKYFNVPDEKIAAALTEFKPNSLVINVKKNNHDVLIIDDGKTSNPKGFKAALKLADELKAKNNIQRATLITAGIVDLGEMSNQIHQELARASHQVFDQVYYLGQNGREEFKLEFQENFIDGLDAATGDLILVEGRVPSLIYATLNF